MDDYPPHPYLYADLRGHHGLEPFVDVDRLRLVAYVDGRLVETWTEPVEASPWAGVAARFDREVQRPAPQPPVPTCERVLAWLDDVCGSREALLALTPDPLVDDGPDLPETPTAPARTRLAAVAELLDAVATAYFGPETSFAFRAALVKVWDSEPEVVLDPVSAAHVAGGIAWVVAKANGALRPQGVVTVTAIRDALALRPTPSTYGKVVQRALVGYRDLASDRIGRPYELPDLLPLGHPDLLVARTRRTLCRARDRALEAKESSAA